MLIHPWAGLPSRQSLYIGLEEVTGWDLMIVTASRWKDDYGRIVRATPDPELKGRLLALPVGLSGNIPLHFFVGGLKHHIRDFDPDCIYIYHEPYAVGTYQVLRAAKAVTSAPVGIRSAQNIDKRYPLPSGSGSGVSTDTRILPSWCPTTWPGSCGQRATRSRSVSFRCRWTPAPSSPAPSVRLSAPLHVGFVGRLVPEKGIDTALQAMAVLPGGTAVLTVIGDGPELPVLRQLAASLGVADAVAWLGSLDRQATADAYRSVRRGGGPLQGHGRWREQFGRVVIEAAATGVPVVATRSGELPFLVESLGAGWIVEEEDAAAMAHPGDAVCRPTVAGRRRAPIAERCRGEVYRRDHRGSTRRHLHRGGGHPPKHLSGGTADLPACALQPH